MNKQSFSLNKQSFSLNKQSFSLNKQSFSLKQLADARCSLNKQEAYWDSKIKEWSQSSYQKNGQFKKSLIEWLAGFFRGPILARMEVALKFLGPRIKNKVVADFGCGVGNFCFRVLEYQPKKVIGLDISSVAVLEAQKKAKRDKVKKIEFLQTELGSLKKMPDFDYCVGLGFIDYLNKQELINLFANLRNKFFFFSFPEKKFSLVNFLQKIYLKTQNCPSAYKYSREEIKKIANNPRIKFITKDKMVFLTNL